MYVCYMKHQRKLNTGLILTCCHKPREEGRSNGESKTATARFVYQNKVDPRNTES